MEELPASDKTVASFVEILGVLRRSLDEVQTSQTIAAFAQADATFAANLCNLMVDAARGHSGAGGSHALTFPRFVSPVDCERERQLRSRRSGAGRCDLWFTSKEPMPLTLAVELKHSAQYGPRQLERYLDALGEEDGRTGLVVVTGHGHPALPRRIRRDRRWLGELRWATLVKAGLEQLGFDDPGLGALWQAFVERMRQDGDLGGTAAVDFDELVQWATWRDGSYRWPAWQILENVHDDAERALRKRVADFGQRPRTIPGNQAGDRVFSGRRYSVSLRYAIGRAQTPRIELSLAPGSEDAPLLEVQTEFIPIKRRASALRSASRTYGFYWNEHSGSMARSAYLSLAEHNSAALIQAAILRQWRENLVRLQKRGALS